MCLNLKVIAVNMYMSSINSFAANWLLLCSTIPFYSGAERSDWIPYEINDSVRHQFQQIQPESVSLEEQFRSNVPKSPQYNVYHPKHNKHSVQPGKDQHSDNVKQNVARFTPEYQLEKMYRPYYSQFVENQETSKKKNAVRLESEEIRKIDEEVIMKKMKMLDKVLSEDIDENDVDIKNTIEDEIIAEMNISEETKRAVRQVRRHRPGFFWTLARLAFETFNDTRSAIQQINDIIGQNIEPDPTTRRPVNSHPSRIADARTVAPSIDQNNTSSNMTDVANATTTMTTSTTQAPFKLTPTNLQNLIRRNLRGLVRLFNIEWQDAMNQSEINVREFQKELGNQVGGFLQDNPNIY